jgi:hypothetical protein
LFDGLLRSQEQLLLLLHVSHASHAATGRHGGSLRLWLLGHHRLGGISAVRTTLAGSITPWLKLTTLPPQIAGIRNDIPFGLNSKKEMRASQCTNDNMITLRAIKGTALTDCRYHRFGESYDFCTWAIESGGESKAPNWLQADAFGFGQIRKIDCESCPAFAPVLGLVDETG